MATQNFDLTLRRHDRYVAEHPAEVRVGASCTNLVRITRSMLSNSNCLEVRAIDFSMGGLGMRTPLFLPRGCSLTVKVLFSGPKPFEFEMPATVQRVGMLDCKPTYYVGCSFDTVDAAGRERVRAMMEHVKASGGVLDTEVRRAS